MVFLAMRWVLFLLILSMTKITYSLVHKIIHKNLNHKKINSGYLKSPNWPDKYPQDVRYIYVFIGLENQQVHLSFNHFNIEGLSHSCDKDYLDVYIEMKILSETVNISNILLQETILGRFCGHNLDFVPHTIVSKYNVVVLDFFSDKNTQQAYNQDGHMGKLGFEGNFTFVENEMFINYWTRSPNNNCYYLIYSNYSHSGRILSPTFPGLLPSPLNCIYEFRSDKPDTRILLHFDEFNLFEHDSMCPVEFIEIIDKHKVDSPSLDVDNKICGLKKSFIYFSSQNRLHLRLVVLAGRNYMMEYHNIDLYKRSLQNIGFKIRFQFSDDFQSLKTMPNRDFHIPGTECDLIIKSKGESKGFITSAPIKSQKFRSKICNYFFLGIHNSQHMEVVQLNLTYFNLPDKINFKCSRGSLSIYSVSFEMENVIKRYRSVLRSSKPERVLCGKFHSVITITSPNPVFILKLNFTESVQNEVYGFKLSYQFQKDYGISGQMVTSGVCHYQYQSHKTGFQGFINSPFYNNFYPKNSSCQYDFLAKPNEMIRLIFTVFQTSEDVSAKLTTYHDIHLSCRQDYLSVSEIVRTVDGFIQKNKTERYCGTSIPGILVSQQNSLGFTLIFKSNSEKSGPGFLASYQFMKKKTLFADGCGSNISMTSYFGYISSPNYPGRYTPDLICEWHLYAMSEKERIILTFTSFQIEGTPKSCSNAVLRIYEGKNVQPQSELCGTDSAILSYLSNSNFIRVRFLTDVTSKGAKGFQIVWTRIIERLPNGSCPGFQCINSGHCINKNLTCNKVFNCGSYINTSGFLSIDSSDEVEPCAIPENYTYLYSGLGIVLLIVLILIIIIIYFIQKNKYLLKRKLRSMDDLCDEHYLSPNMSLKKEIPLRISSGSLKCIPKQQLNASSDNFLLKNNEVISRCRQFSLDIIDSSSKKKRTDNFDFMVENGFLFREKMQKISIV